MGFLYVDGQLGNVIGRGTPSATSANSLFPASSLGDGVPGNMFRFNAAAADDQVRCDLDLLQGVGEAEAASDLDAFAGSGGTWERVTSPTPPTGGGTYVFHLGHTAFAKRAATIQARAGETLNLSAYLRGDGSVAAALGIYNVHTGRWWNGSTWASSGYWQNQVPASWSLKTGSFTVEDFATCRRAVVDLEVRLALAASGDAYFDRVAIWPSWDFLSIHGHNFGPVTADWLSSDDAWSSSASEGTPTIYSPTFWAKAGSVQAHRYVGLELTGTNHEPGNVGLWFVGRSRSLTRKQAPAWRRQLIEDAVVSRTPLGATHAIAQAEFPRRRLELDFLATSDAEVAELDELFGRARGMLYPSLFVPDDSRNDLAVWGRIQRDHVVTISSVAGGEVYGLTLQVDEEPFYSVGA